MMSPTKWKRVYIILLLGAATAVAAQAQTFETLATFHGPNGSLPDGGRLVQSASGTLYGATDQGGSQVCPGNNGCGTVFEVSANGVLKTVYNFCVQTNCADGSQPSPLVLGTDGHFYGTTLGGGGGGTVFKMTPQGGLTTIYSFCFQPNCPDGYDPNGPLLQDPNGRFYGTTFFDGTCGAGTLFNLTSGGKLTTLYQFCGGADGGNPNGALIEGTDGNFYGTTSSAGDPACTGDQEGCGTVFKITPGGKLTTLHAFTGAADGSYPGGLLVQATDGNFYGTTLGVDTLTCDFPADCGTVFKITSHGKLTTIYTFCALANCADGAVPSGLVQGTDGNFYGATLAGGGGPCASNVGVGCGTLFRLTPSGALTTLHVFDSADGQSPNGGLLQATNGSFYGTAYSGGDLTCDAPYGCGTVFRLSIGLGPFVTFVLPAGRVGQTGGILGQGFTGTTSVSLNGTPATYTVVSDTFIRATVPPGATTGFVTVTTPNGTLTSNVPFRVIP